MKVLAINASPRPDGNTAMLLAKALEPAAEAGIETEIFQLGGKMIAGCKACYRCFENKDRACIQASDPVNECILKMAQADGILLGSPTYFADVSPELKALIDRAGLVAMANGSPRSAGRSGPRSSPCVAAGKSTRSTRSTTSSSSAR